MGSSENIYETGFVPVASPTTQRAGNGRFILHRILGQGGMGIVWLARDQNLQEDVALKFLPPQVKTDPVALDDMRRETARSHRLTHPNIVRIHDFYELKGEDAFISMEYIDGPNLSTLRLEKPNRVFSWEFLQTLVPHLCEALDYAHRERVIHRDLKPANLMVDGKGRLKVADFGIACIISDSVTRISAQRPTGSGTLVYMSPQQMAGETPRATDDVYGVGSTLYELLTSKPPFHSGDVTYQVNHVDPKPLPERLAEFEIQNPIPPRVNQTILACLSKKPSERPQSPLEILDRLELHLPTHSRRTMAPGMAFPRRKKWLVPAGAVALAVVCIGGTLFFRRGKQPSPEAKLNQEKPGLQTASLGNQPANTPTPTPSTASAVGTDNDKGVSPPAPVTAAAKGPEVLPNKPPTVAAQTPATAATSNTPPNPAAAPAPTAPPTTTPAPQPKPANAAAPTPTPAPTPTNPPKPVDVAAAAVPQPNPSPAAPAPAAKSAASAETVDYSKLTAFRLIAFGNQLVEAAFQDNVFSIENRRDNPAIWSIIYFDPKSKPVRTVEVEFNGKLASSKENKSVFRIFQRRAPKSVELPRLKVDSEEAYAKAKEESVLKDAIIRSYQMRLTMEKNDPVWEIEFWVPRKKEDRGDASLGKLFISAEDGRIVRREWNRDVL